MAGQFAASNQALDIYTPPNNIYTPAPAVWDSINLHGNNEVAPVTQQLDNMQGWVAMDTEHRYVGQNSGYDILPGCEMSGYDIPSGHERLDSRSAYDIPPSREKFDSRSGYDIPAVRQKFNSRSGYDIPPGRGRSGYAIPTGRERLDSEGGTLLSSSPEGDSDSFYMSPPPNSRCLSFTWPGLHGNQGYDAPEQPLPCNNQSYNSSCIQGNGSLLDDSSFPDGLELNHLFTAKGNHGDDPADIFYLDNDFVAQQPQPDLQSYNSPVVYSDPDGLCQIDSSEELKKLLTPAQYTELINAGQLLHRGSGLRCTVEGLDKVNLYCSETELDTSEEELLEDKYITPEFLSGKKYKKRRRDNDAVYNSTDDSVTSKDDTVTMRDTATAKPPRTRVKHLRRTTIIKPIVIKPVITKMVPIFIRPQMTEVPKAKPVPAPSPTPPPEPVSQGNNQSLLTPPSVDVSQNSNQSMKTSSAVMRTLPLEVRKVLRRYNANVRERDRIQKLGAAYEELRKKVPKLRL